MLKPKESDEIKEKYQWNSELQTSNDLPTITITDTKDCDDDANSEGEESSMHENKTRKSSWVLKMERRRRKGLPAMNSEIDFSNDEILNVRQKRHSWWNIFVPENVYIR